MAKDVTGKSLEDLEKDISCPVCQEHYTEPKILPCLHYYCKKCVLQLAMRTASNKPFSCPECRKKTTLPEGGVDELKTAFFVYRMKDMYSTVERLRGKVDVRCEECTDSENKADSFCRQCAKFICQECVKQHKRMKSFSSHEINSLEDLKEGQAREIVVKEPPTKKCDIHEEPLIVYCFDCDSLICRDCTTKIHRDHNFEFSKVAAPDMKKDLLHMLTPLKLATAGLSSAVEEIQAAKHEVEAQGNLVKGTILTSFAELQQILENRKNELVLAASMKVQEKMDKLSVQEKSLSLAIAEAQSIVDYTERFVDNCSDNEFMTMHAEIKEQILRETEEHSNSQKTMEPEDEADLGVEVKCVEDLKQLCQMKANITRLAIDPARCTVKGEGLKTAEVNKATEITLTIKLTNNKPSRRSTVVIGQLKSLYNESVVKCDASQSRPGEYRIQYTPTVRGRHELTVSVDGQLVAGSPYPVFVYINPTQLGKPVKMWNNIKYPSGITTNTAGDVIVTEYIKGNLVRLAPNGKTSVLVQKFNYKLTHLECASTDDEDNIYCTCYYTNKIMKCNKNGGNVQVHEVKQRKGPGHLGLAVVGDEVMMCEENNKGTIMIYNKELKYMRRIEHHNNGIFRGVSADSHGNIYVTDTHNVCVHVFSNDGVFLRSFSCDSNGVNQLDKPYYLCVSGHYVYITNSFGVAVFTIGGDYVTSFGQYGVQEGQDIAPCGVTTDRDGFVYVADYNNNRVQCF